MYLIYKILCSVPGEYLQRKSPRSRQLLTKQCEAGNEVPSPTFLPIQNMSAFTAPPLLLSWKIWSVFMTGKQKSWTAFLKGAVQLPKLKKKKKKASSPESCSAVTSTDFYLVCLQENPWCVPPHNFLMPSCCCMQSAHLKANYSFSPWLQNPPFSVLILPS